ncbi:hypothetical protein SFA35_05585 [Pseudomonas sp. HR96]|uniref:hypothetical protein n=1 Tax=Pseudomonas sp. HR96 TaxID=1027966 RepID=UPI002A74D33A|nr:hypothetical protein [Pseudomonas sp. HR96]WPP00846.1 hypothetical protein SFA35_05585 [Pseudomonas sp. HR96]
MQEPAQLAKAVTRFNKLGDRGVSLASFAGSYATGGVTRIGVGAGAAGDGITSVFGRMTG